MTEKKKRSYGEIPRDIYTKISATRASEILNVDYDELKVAIDNGVCMSYEAESESRRFTCIAFVREWLHAEAKARTETLRRIHERPKQRQTSGTTYLSNRRGGW